MSTSTQSPRTGGRAATRRSASASGRLVARVATRSASASAAARGSGEHVLDQHGVTVGLGHTRQFGYSAGRSGWFWARLSPTASASDSAPAAGVTVQAQVPVEPQDDVLLVGVRAEQSTRRSSPSRLACLARSSASPSSADRVGPSAWRNCSVLAGQVSRRGRQVGW